ncbi:unnamed protein product, partial [Phaeothamnion confervicola]
LPALRYCLASNLGRSFSLEQAFWVSRIVDPTDLLCFSLAPLVSPAFLIRHSLITLPSYFTPLQQYPRVPGRGWTLDDPDMWAAPTIVLAGAMYVVYNVQIALFPSSYGSDQLYFYADIVYLVNAWLYLFAAMRDVGWCDAAGCCQVHCPLPVILGPWPEEAPYGGHGSGGLELAVPTEDPFDAEPGIGTGSPWKPAAVLQEPLPEGVGGAGAGSGSGGRDGGFGTARDGS